MADWITRSLHGQGLIFTLVAAAAAVILIMLLLSAPSIFAKDYSIDVDPIKDSQNLFSTARVTITNTGKLTLTNIIVNYGGSSNHAIEKLASLSPSDKVILSPPDDSPLKSVTVITDQGLNLTKGYRTPFKIPGMMGS
ncbi:MAG: hypothetical protein E6K94_06695 [Thaumarchaeota archaeon]|nr:MAG: hypothetical protein E6K94_06695 [Nitrososphaerota archaeon]